MSSGRMRSHWSRGLVALGGAAGLVLAGILATGAPAAASDPSGFQVSRISVGTGFVVPVAVATDPATGTAYVAVIHNGYPSGGAVAVIDTATNAVTDTISLGSYYPRGLAVDSQTDTIYVTGYDPHATGPFSAIFVIDGKTDAVTTISESATADPIGLAVDPATDLIYVLNVTPNSITVIDGTTNQVTGSISISSAKGVGYVAVDPATDTIYALGYADIAGVPSTTVWAIDGQTQAVTGPVDLGLTNGLYKGIAVNATTDTIYVTDSQNLHVIDGATDTVTATISMAAGFVGVDPSTGLVYAMSTSATNVIDGASNTVIASFPRGGFSAAADPAASTVYIASADRYGDVWVVTPSTTTTYSPVFTLGTGTTFAVGVPGSYTFRASASPAATFSETGTLPPGLSLSPSGVLSGTPAPGSGGSYYFQLTAANGIAPPDTETAGISVNQAPVFTSPPRTTFKVGAVGLFVLKASGYPPEFNFTETGSLPSGVFVGGSGTTGIINGVPAAGSGGIYKIQITADNGLSATQAFTLTVDQKPAFTSAATAVFTAGVKGRFTVTTTGFPAAHLTEARRLPTGLTFTARPHGKAVITGTPASSARGRYVITITAKNSVGKPASQTLVIRVR